eukprot:4883924-Prymnesium_polylepis.1
MARAWLGWLGRGMWTSLPSSHTCADDTHARNVRTQARRMTPGYSTRGKGPDSDGNGTDL